MVYIFVFSYIFHSVPAIVSPTSLTVKPTESDDVFISSNNITNSTYIISATNPNSTVMLFTSVASYITSSMTKKTVTTSSVINATEAHEHGNSKSTVIPISAFVFGSLLGLCIVVCVIGVILKKQKKKRQIRQGTFMLAASNPLFDRYVHILLCYYSKG